MVADVEIGSLLSGGIDSTLVTAYAQKYSSHPVKTFSVGYDEYINELPFALEASKKIGTDHYTLTAGNMNLDELKNVIEYFDEPHADSSNFPQHLISKLASSKVKVALSGDGADELFMGYGWYQKYWHTPRYKFDRIFGNPFSVYRKTRQVFNERERRKLLKIPVKPDQTYEAEITSRGRNSFEKINLLDMEIYLPGQLLAKVDRTSMMHSLEMRAPFLDTALVEYVYNLPLEFKLQKNKYKTILKEISSEIMPQEFVNRRKQGFGAPIQEWLKEKSIVEQLERIADDINHPMYKYINKKEVRQLIASQQSLSKYSVQKIWSIFCLALWFELHSKDYE